MKPLLKRITFATLLMLCIAAAADARPLRLTGGYLLLSGTDYGTNAYQTYLRFDLSALARMPRREIRLLAEQPYSVFLDFPDQPQGSIDYKLVMPYAPQGMRIDSESHAPVWYGDSVWLFKAHVVTPPATSESPILTVVEAPFTMSGSTVLLGNYNTGFKTLGDGTLFVQFQKVGTKYYTRDAYFAFGETQTPQFSH